MSGYGGQPPGWNDPYGQSQNWDPYGEYAQQGYGYGYGYPQEPYSSGSAIAALVCCSVLTLMCGLLAIPGIVTSAIAIGRVQSDPESARSLTLWSWVIFAINVALMVALVAILIAAGVFAESSSTYEDSGTY